MVIYIVIPKKRITSYYIISNYSLYNYKKSGELNVNDTTEIR